MPSFFRFLLVVAILGGVVWGGMLALVSFVEPQQRDMSQTLPATKFNK